MKQLLITLILSISIGSYSQQSYDLQMPKFTTNKKYKSRYGITVSPALGLGMMLGGTAFVVAGAVTGPVTQETETGQIVPKPFYQQGAKALAIVSGGVLICTGIIITLGAN